MNALTAIRRNAGKALAGTKTFNSGNWVDSNLPGNIYSSGGTGRLHTIPSTRINWDNAAGDLRLCPAVQACLNAIHDNIHQAPMIMLRQKADSTWDTIEEHPLLDLLSYPNEDQDGVEFEQSMMDDYDIDGNAFAVIERNNGGQVAELKWHPRHCVSPYSSASRPDVVEFYWLRIGNTMIKVPPEDMWHLKNGIDPFDVRMGMSPVASVHRGVYTLQQALNYGAAMMNNFGTVGAFISPKDGNFVFDPVEYKELYRDKTRGDNVGDVFASEVPVDVVWPKTTPQDMALDTLQDRPEADIGAVMRVPPQVSGLHVGRLSKTYANYEEARQAFWEDSLMPKKTIFGYKLKLRLLPEFLTYKNAADLRRQLRTIQVGYDFSKVRALQPDKDKEHERNREDWKLNLITLGEWCEMVGRPAPPADLKDKRYMDLGGMKANLLDAQGGSNPNDPNAKPTAGKSITFPTWSTRIEAELAELEAMHTESDGAVVLNGNGKGH